MKTDIISEQSHIGAGGAKVTVTRARGAVRRGMIPVLVISTFLAVVALGAIWIFASRGAMTRPRANSLAIATPSGILKGATWRNDNLGANGLEKCNAFRRVVVHTRALQAAGGGTISSAARMRLQAELAAAKEMPPAAVTPTQCGVPL